jgi:hypothetical protein
MRDRPVGVDRGTSTLERWTRMGQRQTQKQHQPSKRSADEASPFTRDVRNQELSEDTEAVLDDIDEVLEDEA